MATLTNKRYLTASTKEKCEKHFCSSFAQNSDVPRSEDDYIALVSVEIEEKSHKEVFSRVH